jgi:hypothetical protein
MRINVGDSRKARRKTREIIDRAVQKARVPGSPSLGATPGRRYSTGVTISPEVNSDNYLDENGIPVRTAMTEVDMTNDERRLTT